MTIYTLPAELTVYTVNDIYQRLSDILVTTPEVVVLDAAAVEEIDGCGTQLLAYFALQCDSKGVHFQCQHASQSLMETSTLLNIYSILFPHDERDDI